MKTEKEERKASERKIYTHKHIHRESECERAREKETEYVLRVRKR